MKLIDILVRELPKRGGWVKGTDQCAQDKTGEICFYTAGAIRMTSYEIWCIPEDSNSTHDGASRIGSELSDDYKTSIVTSDQYEAALAASKAEWNGEGLPKAGVECEWQDKNTKAWIPVVIAYSSEWVTVVRELTPSKNGDAVECCINNFGEEERLQFRPIRSEADKKRDDVTQSILDVLNDYDFEMVHISSDQKRIATDIVERIASGMIPHTRID